MPRCIAELVSTYDNIVRPVALDVARQLVDALNLPRNINVLLPGVTEHALFPNTELKKAHDPQDSVTFGHGDRLLLEIQENPVEDKILTTAVHQKENVPFFYDPDLRVRCYPIYSSTELQFNFQFRANNRTLARRFRNEMLSKTASLREGLLHELTYYYHVPPMFLHLLKHIHELRENQGGYDETFDEWVVPRLDKRATNITDQVGKNQDLVIREFQVTPMGHFQLLGTVEQEEKDKESGTFVVTFQYKFIFDQVINAVAEWPLMVHGQLIGEDWRSQYHPWSSGKNIDPDRRYRHAGLSRQAMERFTTVYTNHCEQKITDGLVIPVFDEWRPQFVLPNTSTLFIGMMGHTDPPDRVLFDLMGDLDGHSIDPALRDFLVAEAPYVNVHGASVFDIRLYEGDSPMHDGTVQVTPDLIVETTFDRDVRKNYHIRLALVHDLFTLNSAAWERLRAGGEAAIKILNCMQFKLLGKAFAPKLLGGYLISTQDLRTIAQRINDLKVPHLGPLEHVMLTVNHVVVATHRSSENVADYERADGTATGGADATEDPFTQTPDCSS